MNYTYIHDSVDGGQSSEVEALFATYQLQRNIQEFGELQKNGMFEVMRVGLSKLRVTSLGINNIQNMSKSISLTIIKNIINIMQ